MQPVLRVGLLWLRSLLAPRPATCLFTTHSGACAGSSPGGPRGSHPAPDATPTLPLPGCALSADLIPVCHPLLALRCCFPTGSKLHTGRKSGGFLLHSQQLTSTCHFVNKSPETSLKGEVVVNGISDTREDVPGSHDFYVTVNGSWWPGRPWWAPRTGWHTGPVQALVVTRRALIWRRGGLSAQCEGSD